MAGYWPSSLFAVVLFYSLEIQHGIFLGFTSSCNVNSELPPLQNKNLRINLGASQTSHKWANNFDSMNGFVCLLIMHLFVADKSDHLIQSNIACVLLSLGRFEESLLRANKTCELQPDWPKVWP